MKKEIQKTNVIDSWSLQTAHQLSITFSGFSCFVAFFNSVFPLKVVRFEPYHPGRPHPPWALPREKFRDRGGGVPLAMRVVRRAEWVPYQRWGFLLFLGLKVFLDHKIDQVGPPKVQTHPPRVGGWVWTPLGPQKNSGQEEGFVSLFEPKGVVNHLKSSNQACFSFWGLFSAVISGLLGRFFQITIIPTAKIGFGRNSSDL